MSQSSITLTRVTTCYKQWPLLLRWLGHPALHEEGIEWIIVNDAPEDIPSKEVERILNERGIRLLTPNFNIGRSNARNWGASEARGEWIDFVDGDDFPLKFPIRFLNEVPRSVGLIANPVVGYKSGDEVDPEDVPVVTLPWSANTMFQNELFSKYVPIDYRPCGTVWRRSTFAMLSGFDARFDDAWQDGNLVWKAYNHEIELARAPFVKQLFFNDVFEGKPNRLTGASSFNCFRLYERYGDEAHRVVFRDGQVESLQRVRTQALEMLRARGKVKALYVLKEVRRLLQALVKQ